MLTRPWSRVRRGGTVGVYIYSKSGIFERVSTGELGEETFGRIHSASCMDNELSTVRIELRVFRNVDGDDLVLREREGH